MLKRISLILVLTLLSAVQTKTEPVNGRTITVTAGTAVRIVANRTIVSSFLVQMATGGSGRGYVLYKVGGDCVKGSAGTTLVAELSPASSSGPGGSMTMPSNPDPQGGIDLSHFCTDGSNTNDTINVSWNLRN